MKIDFLADTNFLINLHEGKPFIEPFLDYVFGISFISEIELLGHKGISTNEENELKQLLGDCFVFNFSNDLKEQTILLRQKYAIKLPDAIIASTSIIFQIPLITSDQGFKKIKEIDLILLE
ncbi:PIN domain-containing protein [Flavobacterium restrictum]|uniref:Type II toxin-antitoxin system VapC family toxin n=1 Tax=Flavobacterium restrictum TaxID=2594428 RepID=A0A553DR45_9FLAO|nr:PIN domain-containing protein [Flavobacterium restrictum]TRX35251.1 type II toxin-antitoxin system VapC family toxin [Flavobacterium restrictum]